MRSFLALGFTLWSLFGHGVGHAANPIPSAPSSYVYDEGKVFSQKAKAAVQGLLAAQDHRTSEQIIIAGFESLDGEDLVARTNSIFQAWKIGKREKDNGVLLAFYWKERKVRIEVGYGLEALLTDAKAKRVISEFIIPYLKQNEPDQALVASSLAILKTLNSPLIESGEADKILKAGGYHGYSHFRANAQKAWAVWVFLGVIILIQIGRAHV